MTATSLVTIGAGDPAMISAGVNLLRVDGAVPSILGAMHDDGLNGDLVAGDGIYTLVFTGTAASIGQMQLQVSAAFRGMIRRVISTSGTVHAGPAILTVAPNTGEPGQQNESINVTGVSTHWVQGITTASFGAGVTVASLTVNSATSATAVLNIAPSAARGANNVTFTSSSEVVTLTGGFSVGGAPALTLVNPNTGQQGQQSEMVNLTGQLTHWVQDTTTATFAGGDVNGFIVPGIADLWLAAQPDSTALGGDTAPVNNAVLAWSGNNRPAGSYLTFSATGTTAYGGCQSLSPDGDGCELYSTAGWFGISTFTGPSNSLIGVFVNASTPTSTAPDGLDFTAPGATAQATISPLLGQVFFIGDGLTGTGTGSIQQFMIPAGATQLYLGSADTIGTNYNNSGMFSVIVTDLSGGITVTSLTVNSATSATAAVTINPGAVLGANSVTVTTGAEVVAKNTGFTVTPGTPALTAANPNTLQQGQQSISVTLTGQYTHWVQGTTVATFGAGVTVASLTINLANNATAVLNIDPAAAVAARNVTVTTGTEVVALNGGFAVSAGTPVLTLLTPNSGQQGQHSEIFNVTGQYTHWVQGATTASFGVGSTVANLSISSATSATAVLNIDPAAPVGGYDVTFTTGAEVATLSQGFTVFAGTPAPTLLTPNTGQQGQQGESVTVTGLFTSWMQGVTTPSFGAGITVAALTINSATSATAVLNINPSAAVGASNVTFTTGAEVATLTNGFTVTPGTPVLTALNPGNGQQGQQGEIVNVTGQYTHWVQGTTTATFGAGITLAMLTINSATTATAVLNIDPAAALGTNNVSFTTGAEVATLSNGFTVNVPSPEVTLLNPNSGLQAQQGESVSVTGRLTHWVQGTTLASFGAGITVATLTINSATSATAVLNINPSAALGATNVTFTTGAEVAAQSGGFTVTAGAPVLTLVSPNTGQQGQQAESVNLTGQFTHWVLGTTTVSFGAGITVATLDINSATAATAALKIDPAAATGTRNVAVTTGSEAATLMNGFTVAVFTPGPTITSALPGSALLGQAFQVTITGQNTHFQQGVTKANFGAGVSVAGGPAGRPGLVTVTSATSATASVSVPASAATGSRTILVQTGAEAASLLNGFVVKGTPYLSSISPNSSPQGQAVSVTIQGVYTNFQDGVTTAGFGAGISVGGGASGAAGPVTVTGPGTATAQLTIDPAAAPGLRNPVVQTGAQAASLVNNGFTVLGPVTGDAPAVAITSPMEGDQITFLATVTGTVTSPNLSNWILEYQASGATAFTQFGSGITTTVSATFDPTLLLNGITQLRLTATDVSGQTGVALTNVVVAGKAKVGNFTVSFNDLTVPVAGIPITIVRSYDSRNKASGDFGFGWSLDIQTSKVQTNGPLGDGWQGTKSGGFLANFCITAASSHVVTLALQGGDTYTFQPSFSKPCTQIIGPQSVNMIFTPTGTTPPNATLTVPDGAGLVVFGSFPGDVTLVDPDSFEDYDPDQFILTLPTGQQLQISKSFGVQALSDRNNHTLTFSAAGILSSTGAGVAFARNAQNNITTITDPNGNVITYTYSDAGDLTQVQDALGHVSTFVYDTVHDLLSYVDGSGHQPIRNVYDDSGRLIQVIDAFGNVTNLTHDLGASTETVADALGNQRTLVYDINGNILSVTDPLGHVTTSSYDGSNNLLTDTDPLGHATTFTYDANNNRLTQTDSLGHTTTQAYDSSNNLLTTTDANGNTRTNTFDANGNILTAADPAGNVVGFTYDASGNQTSITDALGGAVTYTYTSMGKPASLTDQAGTVTSYTYDSNGNRTSQSVTRTTQGAPQVQTTLYQYDANSELVLTTNPDGTTVQMTYNATGQPTAAVDALGRSTLYTYDDGGRLIQVTYPDGRSMTTAYDADGQRTQVTGPSGSASTIVYDAVGRAVSAINTATGATSQTTFDAAGRKLSATDPRGNTTQYTYDSGNRITTITDALHHVTAFTYDAAGNKTTVLDANGNTTTSQFDSNNRLVNIVYPDATSEQVAYDGNGKAVSKTDAAGKTTHFAFDSQGHLITVTDALGHATGLAYDEVGNRISQTDANGHVTRFSYDTLNRRTGRTLPGGQSESLVYDSAGNVTSRTDFNGKVTAYTYDARNRLTSKTPDPSFHAPAVTYTYMPNGQRASMTDATGTFSYTYDSSDRLVQVTKPNGTFSYSYDLANDLTSTAASSGTNVTYSYDALTRLASVSEPSIGVSNYTYDAVGNLLGMAYPNGVSHTFTYNSKNQLTNLAAAKGAAGVAGYTYTLGPTGRRLSVAELGGRAAAYTYDNVYRLTAETVSGAPAGPNGGVQYTYDAVGNRLQATSTLTGMAAELFTYDPDDRLTTDSYDADGNTTLSGGTANVYDFENHLMQHGAVTFTYDGDGNRVSKTAGGVTTKYLVDDQTPTGFAQVIAESLSDGGYRKFIYGPQRIGQKQFIASSSTTLTSLYVYDGHGSVRALTDTTGTVTDNYDYDAFGNLLHKTGTTPNEFLFAGEQFDADLGLYYNRARYLDPATGRFFTMDTIDGDPESPITLHKYLYGNGDPVSVVDPSGNEGDLGSAMQSLALNFTLNQISTFVFSSTFGQNAMGWVAQQFLPPGFFDVMNTQPLDAGLVGFGVSYTDGDAEGEIPFGLTAAAGIDVVIGKSIQGAVYKYVGAGLTFGATSTGVGLSIYGGALWRTPDSDSYSGWFKNVSLPLPALARELSLLKRVAPIAAGLEAGGTVGALSTYQSQVNSAIDIVAKALANETYATVNLFWDPINFDGGSMGFSLALGASTGSSSNISVTYSNFYQIIPWDRDQFFRR